MERGNQFPNGAADANAAVVSQKTPMEIIQQRFKADETVHLIFEAYQIKGQEHVEGLLALVSSTTGGTYAIISFNLLNTPLTASNELKINKVFPINKSFHLKKDTKGSITENQFDLSMDFERPNKYYYHPIRTEPTSVDFKDFYANITACKDTMCESDFAAESGLSFRWLDDYREIGEVKQEIKKRENEYIVYKDLTIYCGTWNVHNRQCWDPPISLHPWLARSEIAPDIYAIALQEVAAAARIIINGNPLTAQWVSKMLESLHPGTEYVELKTHRLSAIMLTVFVRKELRQHILHSRISDVARGVFNTLGNKGGVAISLQLSEATICFINSHLAAHLPNVMYRNEDYRGIEEGIQFADGSLRSRAISDHDHIFWLGDLNYRVDVFEGLARPSPNSSLESIQMFFKHDQLRTEMMHNRCFNGYIEGDIKFLPSYKYDVGTDTYDTEKCRPPAYCDRILWKGKRITQVEYNSVMEIRHSDHKPVYAIFTVKVKTRDEVKYKSVQDEVLRELDKRENDNQPQITAEKTIIDFGVVRFNEPSICDFNVCNNCPQQVDFQFKDKDSPLNDICESWLNVDPRNDTLMVDSARSIRIRMLADPSSITGLLKKICNTRGKCDFDILILHVISGRDIFITVTGEYQPSCFGLSMENLCRTERPLNEYNQEQMKLLMNDTTSDYRVTMPREFFLLIDYLHKQGDELKGIFQRYHRRQPLSSQFNAVRDWLDTWSESEFPGTPQTAAEALLLLLDLSETPLLEPFVDDLLATKTKSEAMQLIPLLSAPKRNVFMHLCMFLREGVERNHYSLSNVAHIFGRILLRSSKCNITIDYYSRCTEFMKRLISIESSDTIAGGYEHRAPAAGLQA